MRIIAGLAKGMPLDVPDGSNVRPTADRVRGAIFSSLGPRVVAARVLDLFAGTGALGLEAVSRGAVAATLVENSTTALTSLRQNIAATGRYGIPADAFHVVSEDVLAWLKAADAKRAFTLIFADPPYGEIAAELLRNQDLPQFLATDGFLVIESGRRAALTIAPLWQLAKESVYGDTRVSYLASLA